MSPDPMSIARHWSDWAQARTVDQIESNLANRGHASYADLTALAATANHPDDDHRKPALQALFAGLVEPLNDSFRPAGRAAYARWFTAMVWHVAATVPALTDTLQRFGIASEAALWQRYQSLRTRASPPPAAPCRIAVLSRVTVGADILLTSVVVQRVAQRWPQAEVVIIGDGKLQGLLGGLPRTRVQAVAYGRRGGLGDRLRAWCAVVEALDAIQADLVVQPDSRLNQLGILPVTRDPAATWLWENTLPDQDPARSLATHLDEALAAWLGLPRQPAALPRIALDAAGQAQARRFAATLGSRPACAVKLDHGGNPAKSLPREAEIALLRHLRAQGWRLVIDRGFGAEELANSDALLLAAGLHAMDVDDSGKGLGLAPADWQPGALATADVVRFHGSIAGWAGACAACRLAISYDSVGHHLAAALGVPVITAFTGHPDERFRLAWQPRGPATVTVVDIPTAEKMDPRQWQRLLEVMPSPGARPSGSLEVHQ